MEEIEKQKQAEEALNHMRKLWQRIREQLLPIGLSLPAVPVTIGEDPQLDDAVKNMIEQLYVARFVSNSIGRGMAKAEAEEEMEGQIELKNFEIARLWDKLHYYEAVNREMSQRNQEAVGKVLCHIIAHVHVTEYVHCLLVFKECPYPHLLYAVF